MIMAVVHTSVYASETVQTNLALLYFTADVSYAKYPYNVFVVLNTYGEVTTISIFSPAAWSVSS
jgi:hypothetical protein